MIPSLAHNEAQALIPARSQFQDAIAALIKPKRETINNRILKTDSLYKQLIDNLPGRRGSTSDHTSRSLPVIWLDAHDLLADIDTAVAQWHPKTPHSHERASLTPVTVIRLHALSEAKWRPQDTTLLNDYTARLQNWAKTINNLLDPQTIVYLFGYRCPICNKTHIRRDDNGVEVSAPALAVRGDQALCGACKATWWPPMLGRLLASNVITSTRAISVPKIPATHSPKP